MDETLQRQLLLQARVGDQTAIYELFTDTRDNAYFAANQYLESDKDIQQILKDVYIIAFGRIAEIPAGQSFTQWLNYVLAVKCMNYLRGKNVKFTANEEFAAAPDDREPFPAAWLADEHKRSELMRMIYALPNGRKQAVLLCCMGGLSISQAAQCMGVTEIAASGQLQLGKDGLRSESSSIEYAGDDAPVLTQLFVMEASSAVIPPALAKEIYQEMMLFFMGGGKAPKLTIAAASSSTGKGKGYIPWIVAFASVALAILIMFISFQLKQKRAGEALVDEYQRSKAAAEVEEQQYQSAAQQVTPPPPPQGDQSSGSADESLEGDEDTAGGIEGAEDADSAGEGAQGEVIQIID